MKRLNKFFFLVIISFQMPLTGASIQAGPVDTGLIIYNAPSGASQNTDYSVLVRKEGGIWHNLHEYDAEVGRYKTYHTSYVYFDADFSTRIEIKIAKDSGTVTSVKIRPLSSSINFTQSGKAISFFLDKPLKLSIEFNGNIYNNIQIFANPVELNPPKKDDPGVLYFGPGITEAGPINLSSNQTLYIAGGAIVRAYITARDANNVKITGRGILDNSAHGSTSRNRMIQLSNSSNVTIDGIIIIDSHSWTIVPTSSDHVVINNVKILNDVIYSDGIDVVSCQYLTINDVFIRNGDDCISIKARGTKPNSYITITNSIFWSDGAHAILIGPEANGTSTEKINFEKNEILEINCEAGKEWWGTMGITNSGDQTIRDITFKDINVDNFTLSELFNIRIETNRYVSTPGKCIKNIRFINISYNGPNSNTNLIQGYDATRFVDSIYFENLRINGKLILNAQQANLSVGSNASNIVFK